MIASYKEVNNALTHLRKQGEAVVHINLVAYANDPDFGEHPPSCSVTVTVIDPELKGDPVLVANADIPTTMLPFEREFIIPVEATVGVLKRKLLGAKPRKLLVLIKAKPISGFEQYYLPDEHPLITVEAGTILWKSVSLKRNDSDGPRRKNAQLDKRRLRPAKNSEA